MSKVSHAPAVSPEQYKRIVDRFKRLDTNHDNKLSAAEYAHGGGSRSRFDSFDANHDHQVSAGEFLKGSLHMKKLEPTLKSGPLARPTVFQVGKADVYVRTHAMGLVSGTLKKGQKFVAEYVSKSGWAWGYAEGDVKHKGWVPVGSLHKTPASEAHKLPAGFKASPPQNMAEAKHIKYQHNVPKPGGQGHYPYTTRVAVKGDKKGPPVKVYGNPGGGDSVAQVKPGQHVGARYRVNADWVCVLVEGSGQKPTWGFMRANDLEKFNLEIHTK